MTGEDEILENQIISNSSAARAGGLGEEGTHQRLSIMIYWIQR